MYGSLVVNKETVERIDKMLRDNEPLSGDWECLGEFTIQVGDNHQIDVEVHSGDEYVMIESYLYEKDSHGYVLAQFGDSAFGTSILGEYVFVHDGEEYIGEIKEG